jgi:hypothetical protein
MEWYNSITRRLIGKAEKADKGAKPSAGVVKKLASTLKKLKKLMSPKKHTDPFLEELYNISAAGLEDDEIWGDDEGCVDPSQFQTAEVDRNVSTYVPLKRSRKAKGKGKGKAVATSTSADVVDDSDEDTHFDDEVPVRVSESQYETLRQEGN